VAEKRADRDLELERALKEQAAGRGGLTPEQERALFRRLPDPTASRDLVEGNLDLVVEQAEGHRDRGLSFADLYQEGTVGLLDAVGAFDGHGVFRDFASLHIGLQMDSLIESEAFARREAERYVVESRSLDLAQVMFRQEHAREATEEELAELLQWDRAHVTKVLGMLELARQRNDLLTLEFLDDASEEIPGTDYPEPDKDPHRRLRGHGPDE
jgi:DNA-directed RNA polymerase sigma subunit (sigma70/sigma32)